MAPSQRRRPGVELDARDRRPRRSSGWADDGRRGRLGEQRDDDDERRAADPSSAHRGATHPDMLTDARCLAPVVRRRIGGLWRVAARPVLLAIEVAPAASVWPSWSRCASVVQISCTTRPSTGSERWPDPADEDVAGLQVGVHDHRRLLGDHQLVEVAPHRDEPGAAAGGRLGELADRRRCPGAAGARAGAAACTPAASRVRAAERDERVHALVAAEALHVVARDEPAHRVADDVDALVAGLLADLLDDRAEPVGEQPDVAVDRGVVDVDDAAEAAAAQPAAQQREDRAVVDDAVDQDDRRARGLDVAHDQPALHRARAGAGPVCCRTSSVRSSNRLNGYIARCIVHQATSTAAPRTPTGETSARRAVETRCRASSTARATRSRRPGTRRRRRRVAASARGESNALERVRDDTGIGQSEPRRRVTAMRTA